MIYYASLFYNLKTAKIMIHKTLMHGVIVANLKVGGGESAALSRRCAATPCDCDGRHTAESNLRGI